MLDFLEDVLSELPVIPPKKGFYRINLRDMNRKILARACEEYGLEEGEIKEITFGEYSLLDLNNFGLSAHEINMLIDDGIIIGEFVTPHKVAGVKLKEKWKDPKFRKKMHEKVAKNVAKALGALKLKYKTDPGFCEHMKKVQRENMLKAKAESLRLYLEDPEFHERMLEISRRNAAEAREARKKKLKDPEYREKMAVISRKNLEKARERIDELSETDTEWAERRRRMLAESIRRANELGWERFHNDPEFRERITEARRAGRKKRWDSDPEYRAVCIANMKRAAEKRKMNSRPRRRALLDNIIIPHFGDVKSASPSKVVALLGKEKYAWMREKFYPECNIRNRVVNDIKAMREGNW